MLDRRTFLLGAAATAVGAKHRRQPLLRGGKFPTGVLAGMPEAHGAPLCARLAGVEHDGLLRYEVAKDRHFRHVVAHGTVPCLAKNDHVAHLHLRSKHLRPGEEYFYRFATRTHDSRVGRLRTRLPADSREPVRLAFWSCQAYQSGYYVAHRALAQEKDLDAVVGLGDYIYEKSSDTGPRTDPLPAAQTLAQYRAKYHLYQSDPDLRAMHAVHPFVACWDDHEVMSSYYGETPGNAQGVPPAFPFPRRRRNGYRAFFEHLPIERFAHPRDRIYRRLRFGRNAELFLTDLHQYGDTSPNCPGPSVGPINLGPCDEAKDPRRTLLGPGQRAWLEDGLIGSRATWKLWGSSMMLMALDVTPNTPATFGEWSGWEGERNALAATLHRRGIHDLVCFSGDIHTFFAGTWTTSGRAGTPRVGTEFVAGSITSHGIAETAAQGGASPAQIAALTDQIQKVNPHLVFTDTVHHGYALATVSREEVKVELRAPASTVDPHARTSTIASFTVPRGSAVQRTG